MALQASTSPPAQKPLPSPRISTTRTPLASSASSSAAWSARSIAMSSALNFSGRRSVTMPIAPSCSKVTRRSAMRASKRGAAIERQADRPFVIERRRRDLEVVGDGKRNVGLPQHVAFEIDARRELRHHQAVRRQLHHAALGDIGDVLALRDRALAGEGYVLDLLDDLFHLAFLVDADGAIGQRKLGAGVEEAGEDDLLRSRRDVDEAAG